MNLPTPLSSSLLSVPLLPSGLSFFPPPLSVFCSQFSQLIYIINSFGWFYFNSLWRLFLSFLCGCFPSLSFVTHSFVSVFSFCSLCCFCGLSLSVSMSPSRWTTYIFTTVCLASIASNYLHYTANAHLRCLSSDVRCVSAASGGRKRCSRLGLL